jgi:hypothetical protein
MTINLIQSIQNSIGLTELKKIDPNTQQTFNDNTEEDKLNQAAIPAVLIVLYKYTRSDGGAQQILEGNLVSDWLELMLEDETTNVVQKVSNYSEVPEVIAKERMEMVAKQSVGLIQQAQPKDANAVKDILAAERNNILVYLPPALHMGDLLNDDTLDDGVRKMEGPVSSLMNKLSNAFSPSEKGKDD